MYDMVIIGGGPAGLSAAVYAKRAMLNFVLLEGAGVCGGQVLNTGRVDNYPGLYGESGFDISMRFQEHADKLGAVIKTGAVTHVEERDHIFYVHLSDGSVMETRTVVIATGAKHRLLHVPGEERLTGKGVSYCATCDGMFYKGKETAIIGGGDVALEDALYLSRLCTQVYLVHRRDTFRASKMLQTQVKQAENITFLPFYEVEEIIGDSRVEKLRLVENRTGIDRTLQVSGVFIAVGMQPVTKCVRDLVSLDETGYIIAGEDCKTSRQGVFAAGDVRTKPLRQIVTAAADGASAVASAEQILSRQR